jgi:hypothetical protein
MVAPRTGKGSGQWFHCMRPSDEEITQKLREKREERDEILSLKN